MEMKAKRQLIESFKRRYHHADYGQRKRLLSEVCELFTWHRKHAVRRLNEPLAVDKPARKKPGRKSTYGDPE
ncbi:MAG: hypothetical protein KDD62_11900, partial [Bdellovibrionales bacterium]|nr:hypothetical protein [Bdellovibrionales bacterium]